MISGALYEVFGEYWETRNGWGHTAYLMKDGEEVNRARVRYYNRTWESYRFQSAGLSAVDNEMKAAEQRAFEDYRRRTGRSRLTDAMKEEARRGCGELKALKKVLEGVKNDRLRY